VKNGLLLGVTGLNDELVRGLLLVAGLLTLRVAPGAEKVLTTTTGLGTTFTTTVRMVDGFMHMPRTVGRVPCQRVRPALALTTFMCSTLPTWPIVA
jgi:hypothetical protein